jgi:hypothetical protein
MFRELPHIDAILLNPLKEPVPENAAAQYAVVSALARCASDMSFDRICLYLNRLQTEFRVLCVRDTTLREPAIHCTNGYTKWAVENYHVIAQCSIPEYGNFSALAQRQRLATYSWTIIPFKALMRGMEYVITGVGQKRTITARSDRARRRSPVAITFDDSATVLTFVKGAISDGFRFTGQELVDREYKSVKYVYFARPIGGRFERAGQDWGPPDPVFEPGDVYPGGPRNGKQAVILAVVKGESARANGADVMVLAENRPVEGGLLINAGGPPISEALYWEEMQCIAEHQKEEKAIVARYGGADRRSQLTLRTISLSHWVGDCITRKTGSSFHIS